jgi:hypothetical protein
MKTQWRNVAAKIKTWGDVQPNDIIVSDEAGFLFEAMSVGEVMSLQAADKSSKRWIANHVGHMRGYLKTDQFDRVGPVFRKFQVKGKKR